MTTTESKRSVLNLSIVLLINPKVDSNYFGMLLKIFSSSSIKKPLTNLGQGITSKKINNSLCSF